MTDDDLKVLRDFSEILRQELRKVSVDDIAQIIAVTPNEGDESIKAQLHYQISELKIELQRWISG